MTRNCKPPQAQSCPREGKERARANGGERIERLLPRLIFHTAPREDNAHKLKIPRVLIRGSKS